MTEAAGIITQSAHRRLANKAAGMVKKVDDAAQELKADIGAKVDLTTEGLRYQYIRRIIKDTLKAQVKEDPWLAKKANDEMLRLLDQVILDMKEKEANNIKEESAPEYKKRMQALVNPDNWPPPPPYTQPLSWLRARFLYALIPADKNATYKQNVKPWSPPALGAHPGTSR